MIYLNGIVLTTVILNTLINPSFSIFFEVIPESEFRQVNALTRDVNRFGWKTVLNNYKTNAQSVLVSPFGSSLTLAMLDTVTKQSMHKEIMNFLDFKKHVDPKRFSNLNGYLYGDFNDTEFERSIENVATIIDSQADQYNVSGIEKIFDAQVQKSEKKSGSPLSLQSRFVAKSLLDLNHIRNKLEKYLIYKGPCKYARVRGFRIYEIPLSHSLVLTLIFPDQSVSIAQMLESLARKPVSDYKLEPMKKAIKFQEFTFDYTYVQPIPANGHSLRGLFQYNQFTIAMDYITLTSKTNLTGGTTVPKANNNNNYTQNKSNPFAFTIHYDDRHFNLFAGVSV